MLTIRYEEGSQVRQLVLVIEEQEVGPSDTWDLPKQVSDVRDKAMAL
jgi:hypothetical protein